MRINSKDLKRF